MRIPDRWLAYSALGKCIAGTRFICFKVPLKDALCNNLQLHERFTPKMLMEQCPKLGLVIDLTNTNRYYSAEIFKGKGIQYKKLQCPGHVIPPAQLVQEFFKTVDSFLDEAPKGDKLIGVHCTHGLNRTGYFICRYLSLRMGFTPRDAISAFEHARGYKIERQPYIDDIVAGKEIGSDQNPQIANSSYQHYNNNYHPQENYEDGFDPKLNHSYRQNGIVDNYVPPDPRYPHNMNYQPPLAGSSYDNVPPLADSSYEKYQPPLADSYDNYHPPPADSYDNYHHPPAGSYDNYHHPPAGSYDNYHPPPADSYDNYHPPPADSYDNYHPPPADSYDNYHPPPAGSYDNYHPPPAGSYDNYQSPLEGSYDNYEVSNRYSRGYGNPGYKGYSQYRNNPYGRPSDNSDMRRGPYRQEVGRYGNKKWERSGEYGRGRPRGNRSER